MPPGFHVFLRWFLSKLLSATAARPFVRICGQPSPVGLAGSIWPLLTVVQIIEHIEMAVVREVSDWLPTPVNPSLCWHALNTECLCCDWGNNGSKVLLDSMVLQIYMAHYVIRETGESARWGNAYGGVLLWLLHLHTWINSICDTSDARVNVKEKQLSEKGKEGRAALNLCQPLK